MVRQRDQLVLDILERERDQPPVGPFDWAEWRQTREELVEAFRKHGEDRARADAAWERHLDLRPPPQPVDEPVHNA